MKKLFLLLIPLLFTACSLQAERCDFTLVNGTDQIISVMLIDCGKRYGPFTLIDPIYFYDYPKNRDYTLEVKYKNSTDNRWTSFTIHPVYKYTHYYITNNGADFNMFSDTVNGKSEDIKRVLPE